MLHKTAILFLGLFVALAAKSGKAQLVLTSNFGSTFSLLDEPTATATDIARVSFTPFFSTSDFRNLNQLYGLQGFTLYQVDFDFTADSYSFQELRNLSSGSDAIAFGPSGDLFVYNNDGRVGRVDLDTGVETLVPLGDVDGRRVFFQGIDFSPTGELYGVDSTALYRIDPDSGVVTRITPTGVNAIPSSIFTEFDYSESGIIRAITFGDTVWQIDPVSGLGENPVVYSGSVFSSIASNSASVTPPFLPGDVNLDGAVDFLDIAPFIAALSTGVFQAEADIDRSGEVAFLDISLFIELLSVQ